MFVCARNWLFWFIFKCIGVLRKWSILIRQTLFAMSFSPMTCALWNFSILASQYSSKVSLVIAILLRLPRSLSTDHLFNWKSSYNMVGLPFSSHLFFLELKITCRLVSQHLQGKPTFDLSAIVCWLCSHDKQLSTAQPKLLSENLNNLYLQFENIN